MNQAGCENERERTAFGFKFDRTDVSAEESTSATKSSARRFDVFRTQVHAGIVDAWQIIEDIGRTAANIQNFFARNRLNVLGYVSFPGIATHQPGKETISGGHAEQRGNIAN